jgi:hypothetical protein
MVQNLQAENFVNLMKSNSQSVLFIFKDKKENAGARDPCEGQLKTIVFAKY